jgi:outer membrane protein
MNNTIKKAALTVSLAAFMSMGFAQKIAHISLDSLVSTMPETKTAKDVAQSYLKSLDSEMLAMQTELETKYKDYMDKQATMSEPVRQNKEADLQQLQKRIEDFRTQASQDYQKKYSELTAPIMEKAKKGIEAVAKEGGYKYVLDTSVGSVLYFEPAEDIFNAVKKKLDSMPLANIPGSGGDVKKDVKTPPTKTGGGNPPVKGGK